MTAMAHLQRRQPWGALRYAPPAAQLLELAAPQHDAPLEERWTGKLATGAVRDGNEFVVNGQKIWTSNAHYADALFALVPTDPDAPKHRGISFLLIDDIRTPGLTIRSLINMAWEHGVNETFFEEVRVPTKNVLGEVNRGWYVGMTLLDFERSNIPEAVRIRRYLRRLVHDANAEPTSAARGAAAPSALRSPTASSRPRSARTSRCA